MILRGLTLILMACSLAAGGCQYVGKQFPRLLRIEFPQNPQNVDPLSKMRFPKAAQIGDDWDIIILRDGASIELVNRTASSYRDLYLWLNRRYVSQIELIQIGTDNRVQLSQFIDQHRQPFPVGAILAPDKARPLICADLFDQTTGHRHRLVVRSADN